MTIGTMGDETQCDHFIDWPQKEPDHQWAVRREKEGKEDDLHTTTVRLSIHLIIFRSAGNCPCLFFLIPINAARTFDRRGKG